MHSPENDLTVALLIGAGVLLLFMVFFMISIIGHQRKKAALDISRLKSDILLLEKERTRIAYDIHDEIGPVLSLCKMKLQMIGTVGHSDQVTIIETSNGIDQVMEKIRGISKNLLPRTLEKQGLREALLELAEGAASSPGLKLHFDKHSPIQLPLETALHLYRIAQEILHNSIKHSGAGSLRITLSKEDNHISLYIADDGKGFDRDTVLNRSGGLGLRNIISRADLLGATVELETSPGNGTKYLISYPLTNL
ncbi:MAG: ATP-binding protein [Bacteroidota bacterium]